VIAYFGYEQVFCRVGNYDDAEVHGNKIDRTFTQGLENHLAHRVGIHPENKQGFLWVDNSKKIHYGMFYDCDFVHIEWHTHRVFKESVPNNFSRGKFMVQAAYLEYLRFPNHGSTIRVTQYVDGPRDFIRTSNRFHNETPIGAVRFVVGVDNSFWKLTNCGDQGLTTTRINIQTQGY